MLWWAASSSRYRWLKPWGGGLLVSPSLAQTVLVVIGTLLVSQLEDGPQLVQSWRAVFGDLLVSLSLAQTGSDLGTRTGGDLPK